MQINPNYNDYLEIQLPNGRVVTLTVNGARESSEVCFYDSVHHLEAHRYKRDNTGVLSVQLPENPIDPLILITDELINKAR